MIPVHDRLKAWAAAGDRAAFGDWFDERRVVWLEEERDRDAADPSGRQDAVRRRREVAVGPTGQHIADVASERSRNRLDGDPLTTDGLRLQHARRL
eukprot:6463680-Prymnesium_polylepis.1